jgi:hypothetical protein
MSLIDNLVY